MPPEVKPDFLPSDAQIMQMIALVVPIAAIVILYSYRHEIIAAARRIAARYVALRPVHYGTLGEAGDDAHDRPFSAFEQAERPQIVQPVQPPNGDDLAPDPKTIDAAARLLAAGVMGEGAAIELLFDGVRRGGSKRYMAIRDAARARAGAYGWKAPQPELAPAPEPPRVVRVYEGRPDERLVEL